jgi:hypothetical protein
MVADNGHIYEVREVKHEAKNRVTITLFDVTARQSIMRRGTIKNAGWRNIITIDNIEGYKNVEVMVNFSSTRSKIVKNAKTGEKYCLASSLYW